MDRIESEVRAAAERWMQAWVDADRAVLEDSLAEDFALVVSATPEERFERSRWLETCEIYRATQFRYEAVQVRRLAPDVAVMSSLGVQQASLAGTDRSGTFFLVDVWRREDGRWRVCARYSSHPEPGRGLTDALKRVGG